MTTTLHRDLDADGVLTLTIDVPDRPMNVITPNLTAALATAIAAFRDDAAVKGVVIASGKASGFMAGADLKGIDAMLEQPAAAVSDGASPLARMFATVFSLNRLFRDLETCGKPVASAINGLALGGGLELCLATHYRVCSDDPKVQLGLPEVQVGLFPGGGGTQRLPRLTGVQPALPYLLQGKSMSPQEALELGVVGEIAPADEVLDRAKAWVRANPAHAGQPWDAKGFRFPGGTGALHPGFAQTFMGANAFTHKTAGDAMNAPLAILSAVYEGAQLPMDIALRVESKYFAKVVSDPQARNMIRTLFVSKQAAEKGARRPPQVAPSCPRKIGVVGARLMGAGIAMVAAQAGIEVVLLDRDRAAADKGKQYTADRLTKKSGNPDKIAEVLSRIQSTADFADLAGCDLIVEAVFEESTLKAKVTRQVEAVTGANVILGSNTSTLPITSLAQAWSRPVNFVGIHFFSPVEKMPLVEIIVGTETGAEAIAKALDFVTAIRKTPIVVNDSRGFYTSRCFATYVQEGITMLAEGVAPALIENVARQMGMPIGPLAVSDEVGLDLSLKVTKQTKADLGSRYVASPSDDVVEKMNELGRLGRKSRSGFYVYPENGRKYLWPELSETIASLDHLPESAPNEVRERLLYRQLVECAHCFAEGVLETPEDGDLGAIFGWGFASFTGGPFSHMDTLGLAAVVATLDRLGEIYGDRFLPPQQLRDMAAGGRTFYDPSPATLAA